MTMLRVATHVHSDWSYDGSWSLPSLARAFRRRGYGTVLMCEHDRGFSQARWENYQEACAEASIEGLLLVPGIEYADSDNVVHSPAWGDIPFLGAGRDPLALLADVSAAGGTAVLAHPTRRAAFRRLDADCYRHYSAIETWNRKYDGLAPSAEARALALEHGRPGLASLDFHRRKQFAPLAVMLDVRGPVTRTTVQESLAHGLWVSRAARLDLERCYGGPVGRFLSTAELSRRRLAGLRRRPR